MRTEHTSRLTALGLSLLLALSLAAAGPEAASAAPPEPEQNPAAAYGADHLVVSGALEADWPPPHDPGPAPPVTDEGGLAARYEYLAYYPDHLQVHRGDIVYFRRDGFHTVTFSPEGQPRQGWMRRDEIEPTVGFANDASSNPSCGTAPAAPPCVWHSPDAFLNSGWSDLRVAITLPEGEYTYYCTIHPGMEGSIEVVPERKRIASAAEVAAEREEAVARDTATAEALRTADWPVRFDQIGDNRRWYVQAGAITDDQRVAVLQYFPANLTIAPGDEVEFFVPEAGPAPEGRAEPAYEPHTVSFPDDFPRRKVGGFIRYLNPSCDPDGVADGLPGLQQMWPALFTSGADADAPEPLPRRVIAEAVGCPPGFELELLMQRIAYQQPVRAPGNAVTTSATYDDSGIVFPPDSVCRSGCDPYTGERIASTSRTSFPVEGSFSYSCFLHGWVMAGSVTVAS